MSSDSLYDSLHDDLPKTILLEVEDPPDEINEENDSDGIVGSLFENALITNQVIPVNQQLQLFNHLPIVTIIPPSSNFDDPSAYSQISREECDIKLQDIGCRHDELPSKTYKGDNIISVGPADAKVFYYNLISIAVDL